LLESGHDTHGEDEGTLVAWELSKVTVLQERIAAGKSKEGAIVGTK
jgi:hypothetical protein